jgi:hypothetical protein
MSDNPFQPNHAYSIAEYCERASICRRGVYILLAEGKLRARKAGSEAKSKTLITNAYDYFASLPVWQPARRAAA